MNLVFDFGAVLFAWQPAQLVATYFPELAGTPLAAQRLAQAIFNHADWRSFDRGAVSLNDVVQRTGQRLALPNATLNDLVTGIGERLTPMEDTVSVLADLVHRRRQRGDVRLYFLSNMPAPYARTLEQRHLFLHWFDGGIFSGDVQHIKPELAIYQLLQTRYALDPKRTLLIDDLKDNVDAARGLGWSGINFVSAQELRMSLASLLGQHQTELLFKHR
jgi:putative hydrolase of the HAD superfamily